MNSLKTIVAALLFAGLAAPLPAQVVTPSLDPTEPALRASAAGWKTAGIVGGGFADRAGKRLRDGAQVYEYTGSTSQTLLTWALESGGAVEASVGGSSLTTRPEGDYDQPVPLGDSITRLMLGVQGNDFFSMGLGYRVAEAETWFDAEHPQVNSKRTHAGGSLTLRLGEVFYVGGGADRVREVSDLYVENAWMQYAGGLALLTGKPGGTRFRMEYSYAQEPKAEQNASDEKAAAVHPATSHHRAAVELMVSGLLFSAQGGRTVEKVITIDGATGEQSGQNESVYSKAGVLWVPEMGMSLGFYFGSATDRQLHEDQFSDFEVKLGYLF